FWSGPALGEPPRHMRTTRLPVMQRSAWPDHDQDHVSHQSNPFAIGSRAWERVERPLARPRFGNNNTNSRNNNNNSNYALQGELRLPFSLVRKRNSRFSRLDVRIHR